MEGNRCHDSVSCKLRQFFKIKVTSRMSNVTFWLTEFTACYHKARFYFQNHIVFQ